jgi:predicted aldo/keto reductase-like oxidoreductase
MNSGEQLMDNVRTASTTPPGSLAEGERTLASRMQALYRGMRRVGCTGCAYCMPCPSGVAIPRVFDAYNESSMFPESAIPRIAYNSWLKPGQRADCCTGCGECEKKCPQLLPIREKLRESHAALFTGPAGS